MVRCQALMQAIHRTVSCNIIASGGVKTMDDIRLCQKMGLYGTICGKSIYQGTLNLQEAITYTERNGV